MAFSLDPQYNPSRRNWLILGAAVVGVVVLGAVIVFVVLPMLPKTTSAPIAESVITTPSDPLATPTTEKPVVAPAPVAPVVVPLPPAQNPPPGKIAPGTNRVLTTAEKKSYGFPVTWTVRIKAATAPDGRLYAAFDVISR